MQTLAAEDAEKLRAFEQRMQTEGAAAFAAGPAPWDDWDDTGTLGTYQVWTDSTKPQPPTPHFKRPRKALSTRLLTGTAQLALLALLIGSAGVYLTIITPEPRVAGNGVQPPPIVLAGHAPLRAQTATTPVNRTPGEAPAQAEPVAFTNPTAATPAESDPESIPDEALAALAVEPSPEAPAAGDAGVEEALAMSLDTLPGTAAGPAVEAAAEPVAEAAEPVPAAEPDPVADRPQQLALLTPAIETLPENPAARPAPAQAARELTGTWVVNLASYNYESMAQRKLDTFRDKGVNAELVKITVKGKSMIRIRATGYQSRREAIDWIPLLEERLELKGAWVAKYEPGEE